MTTALATIEPPSDVSKFLATIAAFSGLPTSSLEAIAKISAVVEGKPGDTVFSENASDGLFYIIWEGDLTLYRQNTLTTGNQDMTKVGTLKSGDVTGLTSMWGGLPHSATVIADTKSILLQVKHADMLQLVASDAAIGAGLLRTVTRNLRDAHLHFRPTESGSGKLGVAFFDSKGYMKHQFEIENNGKFNFKYFDVRLGPETAALATGYKVVCIFVNDNADATTLQILKSVGVEMIALRCAGFNNVDLNTANSLGITVARVPAYSPYAVAEFAVALMMMLNRKVHTAYSRVRNGNFSLDGLVGFDLYGKTVGVIGTGKIGLCLINIMLGFGCKVLAYDVYKNPELLNRAGVTYMEMDEVLSQSDVLSLHVPLLPTTRYLVNKDSIAKMKKGVMIINTSRGELIKTDDLIAALKTGQVGSAGLDVYESEQGYFFEDKSGTPLGDDVLARLLTFSNVAVTSHQAFLTKEALSNIAQTTLGNISDYVSGKRLKELKNSVNP